jgi:hypothetical protein
MRLDRYRLSLLLLCFASCVFGRIAFGSFVVFGAEPAVSQDHSATGDSAVVAAGSQFSVSIHKAHGGIMRIADPSTKAVLIDNAQPEVGLWEIELRTGDKSITVSPQDAKQFRCEAANADDTQLKMQWDEFPPEFGISRVDATVRVPSGKSASMWNLQLTKAPDAALQRIRFPRFGAIISQDLESLAVPTWMGHLCTSPRRMLAPESGAPVRWSWAYPGELSMQCAAWYREGGPGLFIACDDTHAQRKSFSFWASPARTICGEVSHEPEGQALDEAAYQLPYQIEIGSFAGDWFTAAQRYREWAREQTWSRESRLRSGQTPEWVRKTGVWVWNRGRSPGVLPPATALQKQLGLPVSVFWHWWHGCAYDVGFPEYFPPREGDEPFRRAVAQARDDGLHAMVYMNQRLWGMSTDSWKTEDAAANAVKGQDGNIHSETYNVFDPKPCAPMCIGTPFWRNKYAGLAEHAIDLGVAAIYMDQACLSLACYDRKHPHRPGGGSFWMSGFRELAQDIRRRAAAGASRTSRDVALAGEGCGESWLNSLDMMLSLQVSQERYTASGAGWEVIPFFHAVYHGDTVLFGSYSSLSLPPYDELWPAEFAPQEALALLDRKFSRQFYLEQARAFVWGQQPTIANFITRQQQERATELDYFVRLARVRNLVPQYLLHGSMLRPPKLEVPEGNVDFSRVSIYAGRRGGQTVFQKQLPLAMASAWKSSDGQVGIAIASIADQTLPVRLQLDPGEHSLTGDAILESITENGNKMLGSMQPGHPEFRMELPPLGVVFLELKKRG